MEGFRFRRSQEVAFRDLDALGHVNNAVYLTYLETARLAYMVEVLGVQALEELGIVAQANVSFRSRASLGETLAVGVRVGRVGNTSFDFEYEVRAPDGRLVAEATTVHVTFDYERGAPMAVPDEWRERIESYESEGAAAR